MDTKTAKQIAKELEEQAKMIRQTVKDHKDGILSDKGYKFRLETSLIMLDTIKKDLEYNLNKN